VEDVKGLVLTTASVRATLVLKSFFDKRSATMSTQPLFQPVKSITHTPSQRKSKEGYSRLGHMYFVPNNKTILSMTESKWHRRIGMLSLNRHPCLQQALRHLAAPKPICSMSFSMPHTYLQHIFPAVNTSLFMDLQHVVLNAPHLSAAHISRCQC
jgi:hypothetical protein